MAGHGRIRYQLAEDARAGDVLVVNEDGKLVRASDSSLGEALRTTGELPVVPNVVMHYRLPGGSVVCGARYLEMASTNDKHSVDCRACLDLMGWE
jgi:hypothetical protein